MMNFWYAKSKIHSCWLIFTVLAGFSIGVFFAKIINLDNPYLLILPCFVLIICFWKRWLVFVPIIISCGFIVGLFRGSILQAELTKFEIFYGDTVTVGGLVSDDVDTGSSDQIALKLSNIIINDEKQSGTLWVTTSNEKQILRGDRLIINGKIMKGFGNYSGVMYRASIKNIIKPISRGLMLDFRDWFVGKIRGVVPEPEASLGIGFLVGQKSTLPSNLIEVLKLAGLTHIVVASGYNLTILVRLARRIFAKISKYLSVLVATSMIIGFIAITGLSPSMMRAGLVAGLSLAAWYYGRKFHPIILLVVAISITLMINPGYAWGDVGWLLSFAAFAGVMILSPFMQRYFFGNEKPNFVMQIFCETISAQIATAPILIATFSQISNVALIANILVLPFVPLAMLLTFVAGIGSIILSPISAIIGLPAFWLLSYMTSVAKYFADLPWAVSNIGFSWVGVGICYGVIVTACIYMWRVTKYNLREVNLVE